MVRWQKIGQVRVDRIEELPVKERTNRCSALIKECAVPDRVEERQQLVARVFHHAAVVVSVRQVGADDRLQACGGQRLAIVQGGGIADVGLERSPDLISNYGVQLSSLEPIDQDAAHVLRDCRVE